MESGATADISDSNGDGIDDNVQRLYTNQIYDQESGLYYMNARYYDKDTAMFLIPDPAMSGLNHYAYASGNPIMYSDPTGLSAVSAVGLVGAGIGGGGNNNNQGDSGSEGKDSNNDNNPNGAANNVNGDNNDGAKLKLGFQLTSELSAKTKQSSLLSMTLALSITGELGGSLLSSISTGLGIAAGSGLGASLGFGAAVALGSIATIALGFGLMEYSLANGMRDTSTAVDAAGDVGGDAWEIPFAFPLTDVDSNYETERVFYRGLTEADYNEYMTKGYILSKAGRISITMLNALSQLDKASLIQAMIDHAFDSDSPPSLFISVTDNYDQALKYANGRSDRVMTIITDRAINNTYNYGEPEFLIPGIILSHELYGIEIR